MKTIYYFLMSLSWIAYCGKLIALSPSSKRIDHIPMIICTREIAWLRLTVGNEELTTRRVQIAKSINELCAIIKSAHVPEKLTNNLLILLKEERSNEVVEQLVSIAGKLGIKDKRVVNRMFSIFYNNTNHDLLALAVIEAFKRIKPLEVFGLLHHTIQATTSIHVFERACELPFYLANEKKVLNRLVSLLDYSYKFMSSGSRLKLMRIIYNIKNRHTINSDIYINLFNFRRRPYFTMDSINIFCKILEYEKDESFLEECVDLLLGTYSPKLYTLMVGFIEDEEKVSLLFRMKAIDWVSSLNKNKARGVLLKVMKSKEANIRIHSINHLYCYLTTSVTSTLLDQLVKNVSFRGEREAIIDILWENGPLLKYERCNLFYDSRMGGKKSEKLRGKMIDTFRFVLSKMGVSSEKFPKSESMILDATKLIRYLAYLRDEKCYELLWSILQYQKKKNIYLSEKLSHLYLILYKRFPFWLLNSVDQGKLNYLYIHQASLLLNRLSYFSELPQLVLPYLLLPIEERIHYELLPLIYTGKNKNLLKRYSCYQVIQLFKCSYDELCS